MSIQSVSNIAFTNEITYFQPCTTHPLPPLTQNDRTLLALDIRDFCNKIDSDLNRMSPEERQRYNQTSYQQRVDTMRNQFPYLYFHFDSKLYWDQLYKFELFNGRDFYWLVEILLKDRNIDTETVVKHWYRILLNCTNENVLKLLLDMLVKKPLVNFSKQHLFNILECLFFSEFTSEEWKKPAHVDYLAAIGKTTDWKISDFKPFLNVLLKCELPIGKFFTWDNSPKKTINEQFRRDLGGFVNQDLFWKKQRDYANKWNTKNRSKHVLSPNRQLETMFSVSSMDSPIRMLLDDPDCWPILVANGFSVCVLFHAINIFVIRDGYHVSENYSSTTPIEFKRKYDAETREKYAEQMVWIYNENEKLKFFQTDALVPLNLKHVVDGKIQSVNIIPCMMRGFEQRFAENQLILPTLMMAYAPVDFQTFDMHPVDIRYHEDGSVKTLQESFLQKCFQVYKDFKQGGLRRITNKYVKVQKLKAQPVRMTRKRTREAIM